MKIEILSLCLLAVGRLESTAETEYLFETGYGACSRQKPSYR